MNQQDQGHHPITPVRVYVTIFLALMLFTAITVFAAQQDLGWANTPIALVIAGTKALLVVFFFMELRHAPALTRLAALCGVAWLVILLVLALSDYVSRSWVTAPPAW